jgi:hypothetical protein
MPLPRSLPSLVVLVSFGLALGVTVGWARDASAFCRSTTCTGDCERDIDECKTTGKKLFWRSSCIGYSLQRDGTEFIRMKHVRPTIARCFANWVDLECEDGTASISFSELDDVACRQTEYNSDEANANIVLFQDSKWRYTSADNNLAKTTVTFDDESGEIFDADIEINHAYNNFTISEENVEYDLESIVTHEVGHFIGLDHSLDAAATMNATYEKGSTELRSLEPDDVEGACAAYEPDRDAKCNTKPKGGLRDDCGKSVAEKEEEAAGDEGGCAVGGSPGLPAGRGRPLAWLGFLGLAFGVWRCAGRKVYGARA